MKTYMLAIRPKASGPDVMNVCIGEREIRGTGCPFILIRSRAFVARFNFLFRARANNSLRLPVHPSWLSGRLRIYEKEIGSGRELIMISGI